MPGCMDELILSFPTLGQAEGVCPWDERRFAAWACGPAPSHGARCAARFVLSVWNSKRQWKCGAFDLMEALGCWDDEHRAAFMQWVRAPWWP